MTCPSDGFDIVSYNMGKAAGGGGGGGDVTVEGKSISSNGTYNAPSGKAYSPVIVDVPNSYAAGDEGKVVSNGALVSQTAHAEVNTNGTIDTTLNNSVVVNVSGGGGVTPAPQKQVNFIDYDGTILYSYTAQEANALSALPANPSHSGLTAQGWNWTLAQIKAQLTAMPDGDVWVGQMYITQSGDTEIDVSMQAGRLSPILTIAVNGTVTVDWGDNTTADTVTGSSLTTRQAPSHTYAAPGDYTIVIHAVSGSFTFYGDSSYTLLRKNTAVNENRVYSNCVKSVRFGSGITSVGQYAFYYCGSLRSIAIPNTLTSIGNSAFQNCYALASITIPNNVTSIGTNAFFYCGSLRSIAIPNTLTSIVSSAFQNCYALASITIPNTLTSIGNSAFQNCYGMKEYHIKPTTVPTLGTTAFNSIVSDCVIYAPSAKLNDYKIAENWSAYASYMQGE